MEERPILLVEDNPDDVELTLRALRKGNILNEIVVVHDGQEAIDYLFCKENSGNYNLKTIPGLILLDLKLPKIDGMEVLKKIREDNEIGMIPVVILTSSKEEKDLINGYKLGVNSYIQNRLISPNSWKL